MTTVRTSPGGRGYIRVATPDSRAAELVGLWVPPTDREYVPAERAWRVSRRCWLMLRVGLEQAGYTVEDPHRDRAGERA